MKHAIAREIRQTRPPAGAEEEAFLNVLRTAEVLLQEVAETLKPAGLSPTQYNVLRILRGAAPGGLPCRAIAGRMITRDPDITRLLDRLEKRGLVARTRHPRDRRVVETRITAAGLALLRPLDAVIDRLHVRQLGHMGPARLRSLVRHLEHARKQTMKQPEKTAPNAKSPRHKDGKG